MLFFSLSRQQKVASVELSLQGKQTKNECKHIWWFTDIRIISMSVLTLSAVSDNTFCTVLTKDKFTQADLKEYYKLSSTTEGLQLFTLLGFRIRMALWHYFWHG